MALTTVCYIENNNSLLMLHRIKEENDFNAGKWLGIGGHIEPNESPHNAARREILEETGLNINNLNFQGIVTIVYGQRPTDYIFVFRAQSEITKVINTSEGVLKWVPIEEIMDLNLWEGDRLFLPYILEKNNTIFSIKLIYDEQGKLINHELEV